MQRDRRVLSSSERLVPIDRCYRLEIYSSRGDGSNEWGTAYSCLRLFVEPHAVGIEDVQMGGIAREGELAAGLDN